jgi:hypothetical protein
MWTGGFCPSSPLSERNRRHGPEATVRSRNQRRGGQQQPLSSRCPRGHRNSLKRTMQRIRLGRRFGDALTSALGYDHSMHAKNQCMRLVIVVVFFLQRD